MPPGDERVGQEDDEQQAGQHQVEIVLLLGARRRENRVMTVFAYPLDGLSHVRSLSSGSIGASAEAVA
ncbi:hypothetical protein D3C78_1896830 [compost metagenome]